MANRFLNHDMDKAALAVGLPNQSSLRQARRTLIDKLRRNGEIKDVVAASTELSINFAQPLLNSLIIRSFRKTAGDKMEQRGKFCPSFLAHLSARECFNTAARELPVLLVVQCFQ